MSYFAKGLLMLAVFVPTTLPVAAEPAPDGSYNREMRERYAPEARDRSAATPRKVQTPTGEYYLHFHGPQQDQQSERPDNLTGG